MSKPPDYGGCETGCTHDLARGVLKADLHEEGPYPDVFPLLTVDPVRTQWIERQLAETTVVPRVQT